MHEIGTQRAQRLGRRAALLLLSTFALMASAALAQPIDYWGGVDTSNQQTLRDTIHATIKDHIRVPYTSANWPILEAADVNPSEPGHILDIYKNRSIPIGDSGTRDYDREHVWPQSRGFPLGARVVVGDDEVSLSLNPRADMHNLYLCDSGYNSSRSNNYFADCDINCTERPTEFNNGIGGGTGVYPGNSNWRTSTTWRVWDDRKGDAARAVMYMAARYNGGTDLDGRPEPDLRLTDDPGLFDTGAQLVAYMGLMSVMLDWHYDDLPDSKEIDRHEVIHGAQQNRNPFIDYPEWADCFFLGDCSGVAPLHPQNVIAVNDDGEVTISWSPRPETDLDGYRVYRSTTSGADYSLLTPSLVATTSYTDVVPDLETTYYYVVTAVDTSLNESRFSAEVTSDDIPGMGIVIPLEEANRYIQDFDALGTTANWDMADHWRVLNSSAGGSQRTPMDWADALSTVTAGAGAGQVGGTTGIATNGIYNFGAGAPASATDRALGFLSSGTGTRNGGIFAHFTNTSGQSLTGLSLKYNVEKYRNGTNPSGYEFQLWYSFDGEDWTSAGPDFRTFFPADEDNNHFDPTPGDTVVVEEDLIVNLPVNASIYLQWVWSVASGATTTNSQALGIDDVEVHGLLPADTEPPVVASTLPADGWLLNEIPSVTIHFDEPVNGVAPGDLTVAGSPADNVSGSDSGPYVFTGFSEPEDGPVVITLAAGNIQDLAGNPFAGHSFTVTVDTVSPAVESVSPAVDGYLSSFPATIEVTFTKTIDEIGPDALSVSGSDATSVSSVGGTTYAFTGFDLPPEGAGTLFIDGSNYSDAAGNSGTDATYSFTLDTTAPATTLTAATPALQGDQVQLDYTVVDASPIVATTLLVRPPGAAEFVDSGLTPSDGSFVYTAADSGAFEFAAISEDAAGNTEVPGGDNLATVVVNLVENGPFAREVPAGTGVTVVYPLTPELSVTVTFNTVTTGGTLEITRFIGDGNAAALGLNPARLAGQYFTLTASGGLAFDSAIIAFELDETLFGASLAGVAAVTTLFVDRDGALSEITGADVVSDGAESTVTVSGVTSFSDWYFGDSTSGVPDWTILLY